MTDKDYDKYIRYCIKLTRNYDEAYDLLNTVLYNFLIKGIIWNSTYLYTSLKNEFLMGKRDKKNHLYNKTPLNFDFDNLEADYEWESDNDWNIKINCITNTYGDLTNGEKILFNLYFLNKKKVKDIVNEVDISRRLIYIKLDKIKKKIKECYECNKNLK